MATMKLLTVFSLIQLTTFQQANGGEHCLQISLNFNDACSLYVQYKYVHTVYIHVDAECLTQLYMLIANNAQLIVVCELWP